MIIKGFMKSCIPCPASMEAPTFQTQLPFHLQESHSVELKKALDRALVVSPLGYSGLSAYEYNPNISQM